jgi:outer membrane protein insertion porin family
MSISRISPWLRLASGRLAGLLAVTIPLGIPVNAQSPFPGQPPNYGPPVGQGVNSVANAEGGVSKPAENPLVAEVRIVGNRTVNRDRIISNLRTRIDRTFDPATVQADKRRLITTGLFREVRVYRQTVPQGVVVTFEVLERPTIQFVRFHGDRRIREKTLLRETGLEVGEALNLYAIEESRRKLQDFYRSKGFPKATVTITEGDQPEHRGVAYSISEGPLQRIKKVEFVGNAIASDQRLKALIQSKPGYFGYFFRGKVDLEKIDQDTELLTKYYRGLGFFSARVGRQLDYDGADQNWLTLRFVVDEGPRYVINGVSVVGNDRFEAPSLVTQLNLKTGDYFNLDKMNRDVSTLRDLYGGQGHIFANVEASPRFLSDAVGRLDLVYNVEEGEQFRVGRINVHIAGENPHTRESVVRNRLSLRTGDVIDIREVRASERRLISSQLFESDAANGKRPRIEFRTPRLSAAEKLNRGSSIRGQSPERR